MIIRNHQDVNQTLLKIGRLQRDIKAEEILLNDAVENMKKLSLQKVAPLHEERDAAEEQLLDYIGANKSSLISSFSKSVELPFGIIGVKDGRLVPVLMRGYHVEDVAKQLFRAGFKQCVNIRYQLIKTALVNVQNAAERLGKFGVRFRQKKNVPYYTINEQKIAEEK